MRFFALALLLTVLNASGARGDETERARELYQMGQTAFESGHFAEAAGRFEQAYELSRRPALLWDAAQAYQKQWTLDSDLRALRKARTLYHNFSELGESPQERADAAREEANCDRVIRDAERPPPAPAKKPLVKQWWFWTSIGAGVLVATSVGLGVGLSQSPSPPRTAGGNWGPFP